MSYSLLFADPVKDREDILKLWEKNIPDEDLVARYDWLYFNNPAGAMRTVKAIDEKTGQVTGIGSLYPRYMSLFGRSVCIGIAADFMIDIHHRVFGPAVQIQRKLTASIEDFGFAFIFAFPNKAGRGVFTRVGYEQIGIGHRYVKLLTSKREIKKRITSSFWAQVLAYIVDPLFFIEDYLKSLPARRKYQTVIMDDFSQLDHHQIIAPVINNQIIGDKSLDYLRWRYKDCSYQVFSLNEKKSDKVSTFLIFSVRNDVVSIIDIVGDGKALMELLQLFAMEMRRRGGGSITTQLMVNPLFVNRLKKLRFFERENDRPCYACFNSKITEIQKEKILCSNHWFIFESDMDI